MSRPSRPGATSRRNDAHAAVRSYTVSVEPVVTLMVRVVKESAMTPSSRQGPSRVREGPWSCPGRGQAAKGRRSWTGHRERRRRASTAPGGQGWRRPQPWSRREGRKSPQVPWRQVPVLPQRVPAFPRSRRPSVRSARRRPPDCQRRGSCRRTCGRLPQTMSYVVIARWSVYGAGYVELDCSGRRRTGTDHLLAVRLPQTQPRYERHPRNYLAFLGLAAAMCCYKRLLRLTA